MTTVETRGARCERRTVNGQATDTNAARCARHTIRGAFASTRFDRAQAVPIVAQRYEDDRDQAVECAVSQRERRAARPTRSRTVPPWRSTRSGPRPRPAARTERWRRCARRTRPASTHAVGVLRRPADRSRGWRAPGRWVASRRNPRTIGIFKKRDDCSYILARWPVMIDMGKRRPRGGRHGG